jgi:hypothetical protein
MPQTQGSRPGSEGLCALENELEDGHPAGVQGLCELENGLEDGHPGGVQDGSQGWRAAPPLEYGIKS